MLQRYGYICRRRHLLLFLKIKSWHGSTPAASFATHPSRRQGLSDSHSAKALTSSKDEDSTTNSHSEVFSTITAWLKETSQPPSSNPTATSKCNPYHYFAQLRQFVASDHVSASDLWGLIHDNHPRDSTGAPLVCPEHEQAVLREALCKLLQELATQESMRLAITPIPVLKFIAANQILILDDWVSFLSLLARNAFTENRSCQQQRLGDWLTEKSAAASRLWLLFEAWHVFLNEGRNEPQRSESLATNHELVWPKLRKGEISPSSPEDGTDFVDRLMNSTGYPCEMRNPDLDRQLAFTSIMTLAALYHNLRAFYSETASPSKAGSRVALKIKPTAGKKTDSSSLQPNWHLGAGQETYWVPDHRSLSSSEASLLYHVAQAAKGATLNVTLLRITLAKMRLPEEDVLETAQICHGFQSAVPAIMEKLQQPVSNEKMINHRLSRRFPLQAYIRRALAVKDMSLLEQAATIPTSMAAPAMSAPCDILALFDACLATDRPGKALYYSRLLPRTHIYTPHAWRAWLEYALEKKDLAAVEALWNRFGGDGGRPTSKMWYRRLDLLHQSKDFLGAWDQFCTLVRFSGKNRKLVGPFVPGISLECVDIHMFHKMIHELLEHTDCHDMAITKAKETMELLRHHSDLKPTRTTYKLFVRHSLRKGDPQSAVDWLLQGRSQGLYSLPGDYAELFEHELVELESERKGLFAKPLGKISDQFNAISDIMLAIWRAESLTTGGNSIPRSCSTILSVLQRLPLVDNLNDEVSDPEILKFQNLYEEIIRHLAQPLAKQPWSEQKGAHLRLLILLWDHCALSGIPPSLAMLKVLRSTIYSLHPGLQEELLSGAVFDNYNLQDPVAYRCYRVFRLIGPGWFAKQIKSVPRDIIHKSRVRKMVWNGYDGVTDQTLADAGIALPHDRRKILAEVQAQKSHAASMSAEAVQVKDDRRKESIRRKMYNAMQNKERISRVAQELGSGENRQADEIEGKEQTAQQLLNKPEAHEAQSRVFRYSAFTRLVLGQSDRSKKSAYSKKHAGVSQRTVPGSSRVED